jgi:hypothetical protein
MIDDTLVKETEFQPIDGFDNDEWWDVEDTTELDPDEDGSIVARILDEAEAGVMRTPAEMARDLRYLERATERVQAAQAEAERQTNEIIANAARLTLIGQLTTTFTALKIAGNPAKIAHVFADLHEGWDPKASGSPNHLAAWLRKMGIAPEVKT